MSQHDADHHELELVQGRSLGAEINKLDNRLLSAKQGGKALSMA